MATHIFYASGSTSNPSTLERFFVKDISREMNIGGFNFTVGSSHTNNSSTNTGVWQTSSIIGGVCNCVNSTASSILNGCCNRGTASSSLLNNSSIVGGKFNRSEDSDASAVLVGCDNKIYGNCSVLIGGNSNLLGSFTNTRPVNGALIGGGGFNTITGVTAGCTAFIEYSLIGGGYGNKITTSYSSILGGRQNLVSHVGATVIGDGGARDKLSRGACSLSLDFDGGIFLTGRNITLSPSPLGNVDFCNSNLINSTPNILNVNSNFSIGTGYNSRVVLANSTTQITGILTSGNVTGFNLSIIQVGAGQIQISGIGPNVIVNSYNNQLRTAGQFASISLLHSGNNGYIMYGNTTI